ncbi:sulfoxide reductase heme-binding subunit YedZ [Shimia isoporae]|uniref:Sulfoxide reductase heme-binding subunit YedZ n=1 Tax=Shimia isoporae TaxID=647720 RepID=A0A4R1N2D8_9RHOB|nr:ferric reductase-like transmembrane domain-containing protein [Shimia isoporae]TCL00541.1 sulfoxide reductase heme-binding subunit YedZ [Shimia isoporae]
MTSRFSPYGLWTLFALPLIAWSWMAMTSTNPRIVHMLVHPTGEWSARLLIITMMITPLAMLFKGKGWTRWLKKNRRYFGVAAFAYAALHTVFYLIDRGSLPRIINHLDRTWIWTGWVAFVIFIPLAVTSTDAWVRKLGTWWKPLQRWTYVAALFTLVHWAALHDWKEPAAAIVHFAPLAALEAYRLWYWYLRPRPARAA